MLRIGVIVGSTRPGRKALDVAKGCLTKSAGQGAASKAVLVHGEVLQRRHGAFATASKAGA
jgi:hypothetical protein